MSREVFGEQGRAKVVENRLTSAFERALPDRRIEAMIGGPAAEVIDHRSISLGLEPASNAAELPGTNPEFSGSFSWGKEPIFHLS